MEGKTKRRTKVTGCGIAGSSLEAYCRYCAVLSCGNVSGFPASPFLSILHLHRASLLLPAVSADQYTALQDPPGSATTSRRAEEGMNRICI